MSSVNHPPLHHLSFLLLQAVSLDKFRHRIIQPYFVLHQEYGPPYFKTSSFLHLSVLSSKDPLPIYLTIIMFS